MPDSIFVDFNLWLYALASLAPWPKQLAALG